MFSKLWADANRLLPFVLFLVQITSVQFWYRCQQSARDGSETPTDSENERLYMIEIDPLDELIEE
jgi:hypothetical protein